MKILKYALLTLMTLSSCYGQFQTNTITTNLNVTTASVSDYNAFTFNWSAENDQALNVTFSVPATTGTLGMRLAKSKSGPIYMEVLGWTVSGSNATVSFVGSNVPPVQTYFTEFGIQSGGSFRTLAKGKVNVASSLWSSTNYYASSVSHGIVTTNINIPDFTWVGQFPASAIPQAELTSIDADTVDGYHAVDIKGSEVPYYIWGSIAGPATNPATKLAQLLSPASQPVWTSTVATVTNGMILGNASLKLDEQPRLLTEGIADIHLPIIRNNGSSADHYLRPYLRIIESNQSTVVQTFSGDLMAIPKTVSHIDFHISITNDINITDTGRFITFYFVAESGWNSDSISVFSQDGELAFVTLGSVGTGVFASQSDMTVLQARTNGIPFVSTLNGTNGVYWISNGTNYWILFP